MGCEFKVEPELAPQDLADAWMSQAEREKLGVDAGCKIVAVPAGARLPAGVRSLPGVGDLDREGIERGFGRYVGDHAERIALMSAVGDSARCGELLREYELSIEWLEYLMNAYLVEAQMWLAANQGLTRRPANRRALIEYMRSRS